MAGFFDKFKDGVVKGATAAADKGSQLVELGKIKAAILKLDTQKADIIKDLGGMFYEMIKKEDLHVEALRAKCDEITEIDRQIAEKRAEEERIKAEG